jgi:L-ribulose-5-phosphate 3-epimerase
VIGLIKELAPEAERAGVILGFENTSSGADNRYAIDKVNSNAFKVWYDVGNSTFNGYDVPKRSGCWAGIASACFTSRTKGIWGRGR